MLSLPRLIIIVLFLCSSSALAQTTFLCSDKDRSTLRELRIYDINRPNREPFHERFQDHAIRIMKKYKFNIVDMWESDTGDKLQLVYIVAWPDKATMDTRWKAFRADPEWAEIRKRSVEKHGDLLLANPHTQLITRVSYSPACKAAPITRRKAKTPLKK